MSTPGTGTSARPLAWAERAHVLVEADPRAARALAERALAEAKAQSNAEAEVAARYAQSWALHTLGLPAAGRRSLHAGIRVAEHHGDRQGAGLLRRHLAYQLAAAGRVAAARRELDTALSLLSGPELTRSEIHRLEVHRRARRVDPALDRAVLAASARAARALRRSGDNLWAARLHYNRGGLYAERGNFTRAEADFRRAAELYGLGGASAMAASTAASLAQLELLQGDLVGSLRTLDTLERTTATDRIWIAQSCRVLALGQARLLPEARRAGERYLHNLRAAGLRAWADDAMLELVPIIVDTGDFDAAHEVAARVARSFAARGMRANAALARSLAFRARASSGTASTADIRAGIAAADVLAAADWQRDSLRARVAAGRAALGLGAHAVAREQLALAAPLLRLGSVADRIELRHTEALLRRADGDRAGAIRLLDACLRTLDSYRAALGALELRVAAASIGSTVARDGLRLALELPEPTRVLKWSERLHADTTRIRPVKPAADGRMRHLLTELRAVETELRDARTPSSPASRTRRARLEAAIRDRSRLLVGSHDAITPHFDLRAAKRALDRRVLVEYAELDGNLYALTLARGKLALAELGREQTRDELEWLLFDLARAAHTGRDDAPDAARALETRLLAPLLPMLGNAPLVIVPTGALYGIPWAALPSLRGRSVVVAPSAATWTNLAARTPSRARRSAFIAGPRLRHAAAEVRAAAKLRKGATVLTGTAANADATLAAIDGAKLAHIACHGRFRADSPLFSSLELADGPLNVHELQRLRRAPETVVLSACDLAVSELHPGDELLGLAAALLGLGTRTVVASVVPVPDAAAKRLMLDFHRRLAGGATAAAALAAAQERAPVPGFLCLGSG